MLAGENISSAFVVPTVASAIDIVVHLRNEPGGRRQVREIVALTGRTEGSVVEIADIFHTRDGQLVRAQGYPPHEDRFEHAGIDLRAILGQPERPVRHGG
jgi:pilus assembly protein CpaF